ncbi:MAG TPA: hypothetical protein VFQ61_04380, partial [Polyangiaceae bacterium]|nr:hypothetical protein [Polyangiaceae bacterium]
MGSSQLPLFGHEAPSFDRSFTGLQHIDLGDGAWLEYRPEWLKGAQTVFESLLTTTRFRETEQWLYERNVKTPRLIASLPEDGPGHPLLFELRDVLSLRYA